MSRQTIRKKNMPAARLAELSSIRPSVTTSKPSAIAVLQSANASPITGDSELLDSFSRIDLGISETLKTRKPRCCTNCKKNGHFRNKCPDIMSKSLIPVSNDYSRELVTSNHVSGNHDSAKSAINSSQLINAAGPPRTPIKKHTALTSIRPPPTPRTEVQAHGKTWEIDILVNVYGADAEKIKKTGYTSKYDLKAEDNKLDNCNLSVKTTGSGTIYMGDCLRIFNSVTSSQPYHLVVISYAQRGTYKHITKILEFDITGLKFDFFGTLTLEQINRLATAVKAIPQKISPTPAERKALYDLKKTLQPLSGIVGLDIKCNSQQSRLQCSISAGRFKGLLDKYPARIIATSNTNEFRGGSIRESIPSEKRILKKKDKSMAAPVRASTDQ